MERVIIESPFKGDYAKNKAYLFMAIRDSLNRGEAPMASHLFYTEVLDDGNEDDRMKGINAGLSWGEKADSVAIYKDLGISKGMELGIERHIKNGTPIEYRTLEGWDLIGNGIDGMDITESLDKIITHVKGGN